MPIYFLKLCGVARKVLILKPLIFMTVTQEFKIYHLRKTLSSPWAFGVNSSVFVSNSAFPAILTQLLLSSRSFQVILHHYHDFFQKLGDLHNSHQESAAFLGEVKRQFHKIIENQDRTPVYMPPIGAAFMKRMLA